MTYCRAYFNIAGCAGTGKTICRRELTFISLVIEICFVIKVLLSDFTRDFSDYVIHLIQNLLN